MENELIEELEEMMMNTKSSSSSSSNTSNKRKRNEKAIMLCTTKPSYTLKTGDVVGSLRCENRNRLWYLLGQLVRRQNWSEASGVLSVLLIATLKETSLSTNRTKYWATLEILKHIGAGNVKPRKIQQVYDIWFKKISGSTKGRFDVIQEYVLFLLSQGDIDGAYQAAIGLQQENVFRSDGIANLTVGLVFCHLWYNAFKKELQPRVQENVFEAQLLSNYEEGAASNTFSMEEEAQDYYNMTTYGDSDDDEINDYLSKFPHTRNKQYASVFYAHNVENLLLPLQFPSVDTIEDFMCFQRKIKNDHYKAAVKHLQTALHTTPSVEALVPLIQMLTIGDQIKEAAEAVESVVENSNVAIPFRLRASLLEIFSNEESSKLHICFEDILTKDPTCRNSVLKLINLHHNGYYRLEKLIEMIALHLEATYADSYIWKEFASCFIRLVDCDEDRISSTNDDDDVSCTKRTSSLSSVPDMFLNDTSSETWKLRCRWWRTRHFTKTILSSETDAEKMELVGYKAASACHLYGIEFPYVVTAHTYLKSRKNKVSSVLKVHMKNAIGLSTRLK